MAWRITVLTETGDEKLEMSMDELKDFVILCAGSDEAVKKIIEAGFAKADRYLREATVGLR